MMVGRKQEVNKLIIAKIESSNRDNELKKFLKRILQFEREYFNEEMDRYYSSFYEKELNSVTKEVRK